MRRGFSRESLLGIEVKEKISLVDVLLVIVMILLVANIFIQSFWLSPVKVDGTSMLNTLQHEDWIYMDKIKQPERGDVVVFKVSEKVNYVKRIIALPGDSVKTDKGKVMVKINSQGEWLTIAEPYAYYESNKPQGTYLNSMIDIPQIILKEDEMFVLGDNRWGSKDSREIGPIKESSVLGIVPNWSIKYKEKYGVYLEFIAKVNTLLGKETK